MVSTCTYIVGKFIENCQNSPPPFLLELKVKISHPWVSQWAEKEDEGGEKEKSGGEETDKKDGDGFFASGWVRPRGGSRCTVKDKHWIR